MSTVEVECIHLGNHAAHIWRSLNSPRGMHEVPAGTDVMIYFRIRGVSPEKIKAAMAKLPGAAEAGTDVLCLQCWAVFRRQDYREWQRQGASHPVVRRATEWLLMFIAP